MDNTNIIQIVAGALALVVLIILVQRRRTRVK
jgi:LPXTG-motif cell wall-anchored protein